MQSSPLSMRGISSSTRSRHGGLLGRKGGQGAPRRARDGFRGLVVKVLGAADPE